MKGTPIAIVSAGGAEGKPVDDGSVGDWQEAAYRVAQDAAMAAFRYLRSKGYCKGLDVDTLGDAKAEGALAVYPVVARYMRRYQAALSYERVIRRAHNAERRFLRSEARERHASLDYHVVNAGDGHEVKVYDGAHLSLEQKGLSLEESAIVHESLEAALSLRLDWPIPDDVLVMADMRLESAKAGNWRSRPRYAARKSA